MVDRTLQALSNSAIILTEVVGPPVGLDVSVDPTPTTEITSIVNADMILVGVGGVIKKITLANMKTVLGLPLRVYYNVLFSKRIEVTGATNVGRMQFALEGTAAQTNTIKGIKIAGSANYGSSGTTSVTVSDLPYNTAVSKITTGLGYSSNTTVMQVGSILLTASPPVFYVFCENEADHNDVQVQIEIEVT